MFTQKHACATQLSDDDKFTAHQRFPCGSVKTERPYCIINLMEFPIAVPFSSVFHMPSSDFPKNACFAVVLFISGLPFLAIFPGWWSMLLYKYPCSNCSLPGLCCLLEAGLHPVPHPASEKKTGPPLWTCGVSGALLTSEPPLRSCFPFYKR